MHPNVCIYVSVCKHMHKNAVPACPNKGRSVLRGWGDDTWSFVWSVLLKSLIDNGNDYSGCKKKDCAHPWKKLPHPASPLPQMCIPIAPPRADQSPLCSPAMGSILLRVFCPVPVRWTQLNYFHCQSCWSSSLGLKYKSLHKQIQGRQKGRNMPLAVIISDWQHPPFPLAQLDPGQAPRLWPNYCNGCFCTSISFLYSWPWYSSAISTFFF